MKRIHTLKRTVALFLAMLLSATSTAFASWDSFQGNDANNGTSAYGVTSTTPAITTVNLPNDGATTGLDVEPLVHGDRIYAFHNGGKNGPTVTAVSATDGSQLWTMPVSSGMVTGRDYIENVSQVSNPVIDSDGKNLYGVYTYNFNCIYGAQTDFYPVTIGVKGSDVSTATASYTGVTIPADYSNLQLDTNLSNIAYKEGSTESLTGTATLTNRETGAKFTFTGSSYEDQNFSLYYGDYLNGVIPAGSYDLEVTITNNTSLEVTWRRNRLYATSWKMFGISGISGIDGETPALIDGIKLSGYGQAASPLTLATGLLGLNDKLYFGIYDGERSYYQYDLKDNSAEKFTPADNDQFYYAGAVVHGDRVYFGSESGKVYIRHTGATFGNPKNGAADTGMALQIADAAIRSSIVLEPFEVSELITGRDLYFTSYNGKLWRVKLHDDTLVEQQGLDLGTAAAEARSTGTPTISGNNVYVTTYGSDPTTWAAIGTVKRIPKTFTSTTTLTDANTIYNGDGVQCSPVVYRTGATDYVYFTTNVSDGTGYCYRVRSSGGVTPMWNAPSGNYSLQGFAVGSNYMVFGNDGNALTIVK